LPLGARPKLPQAQRPPAMQRPWIELMAGLSLQLWSCPTVQMPAGPAQVLVTAEKQPPPGQRQVLMLWLFSGEQPQAAE